ncbi:MAG TPA: hypothetical protein VF628_06210 [Allosphingosinicella sp.]|jgi:hypothetical protein
MPRQTRHVEEALQRMIALREPQSVENTIARFDAIAARIDGHTPRSSPTGRRSGGRKVARVGRKIANVGIALGVLIAATIGFGLIVGPIGIGGLFLVVMAALFALIFFSFWPTATEPKRVPYSDELPTGAVVRQLDGLLAARRAVLPAPAARRVDAISQQLPLLESRLTQMDALDPLAQDARRLMGKHLPDLIDRYERVPAEYRGSRDGQGLTVDERLVASLDAAREALGELGAKMSKQDIDAFETQGRFIENRYKDGGVTPED